MVLTIVCLIVFASLRMTPASVILRESKLRNMLFQGYDSRTLPRVTSGPVPVNVSLNLRTLGEVNEKEQRIKVIAWFGLTWVDDSLQWNPSDYDDINEIVMPLVDIWSPDLAVVEGMNNEFRDMDHYVALIHYTGTVLHYLTDSFEIYCPMNMRKFPFDKQSCNITVIAYGSTPNQISIHGEKDETSYAMENGEWKLSLTVEGSQYTMVSNTMFRLHMQRKHMHYVLNVILPVVVLAVLNLMMFCMPPESGETVSFGTSVLLAFSVWLLMFSDNMPRSSDTIPYITIYVLMQMIVSAVCIIICAIIIRFHLEGGVNPASQMFQKIAACYRSCWPTTRNKVTEIKENHEPAVTTWQDVARTARILAFVVSVVLLLTMTAALFSMALES